MLPYQHLPIPVSCLLKDGLPFALVSSPVFLDIYSRNISGRTIKRELIQDANFETPEQAQQEILKFNFVSNFC